MIIAAKRALMRNAIPRRVLENRNAASTGRLRHKDDRIVGASHVGRRVMSFLKKLPERCFNDPYVDDDAAEKLGVRKVDLPELMRTSDIVSLHAPSVDATHHMINRDTLALMKHGASLINTARGSLIDEQALIEVLEHGKSGRLST